MYFSVLLCPYIKKSNMALVNEYFLELPKETVFSNITKEVEIFKVIRPTSQLIDLSINDVTCSLAEHIVENMHKAVNEMAESSTFHGYGPEQGYVFLREAIIKNDFNTRGIQRDWKHWRDSWKRQCRRSNRPYLPRICGKQRHIGSCRHFPQRTLEQCQLPRMP